MQKNCKITAKIGILSRVLFKNAERREPNENDQKIRYSNYKERSSGDEKH